jgi:hypothetical protein
VCPNIGKPYTKQQNFTKFSGIPQTKPHSKKGAFMTNVFHEPIWFQFSGHKDDQNHVEENVNSFSGKTFLIACKEALLVNGWSESIERYDSKVFAEDWGWCLFMRHESALMMLGAHVLLSSDLSEDDEYRDYLAAEWIDCGLSVTHFHKRTLGDRLRGRNKVDPLVQEKAYRSIWDTLASLNYVRDLSIEQP